MSKFAVGEKVDNAADDHESGTVVAVFPTDDGKFRYASMSLMCAASRNLSPPNFTKGMFRRVSSISSGDGFFLPQTEPLRRSSIIMPAAELGNRQSRRRPHGVMPGRLFYALDCPALHRDIVRIVSTLHDG